MSTNRARFYAAKYSKLYNLTAMQNPYSVDQIDQLTQCVEQLLQRYEALQHTSATLVEQISTLTQERNALKLRLDAAHAHAEALIERLPKIISPAAPSAPPAPAAPTAPALISRTLETPR